MQRLSIKNKIYIKKDIAHIINISLSDNKKVFILIDKMGKWNRYNYKIRIWVKEKILTFKKRLLQIKNKWSYIMKWLINHYKYKFTSVFFTLNIYIDDTNLSGGIEVLFN